MESTAPTIQTTAPQPSAMPTASAPSLAYQSATSAPSLSQVPQTVPGLVMPQAQAAAPAAPTYQKAVAPQDSGSNPWQQAFQALSASLNTPQASQAPAQYSAYQTPTPQANTQAAWSSYAATPTYSQAASAPTYSDQEVRALLQNQQHQLLSQLESGSGSPDSYLSAVSDVSLEVLEHFGSEAPALLNNYACAVEDALIEQVQRNQSMNVMLDAASEERAAMNIMLTNPDILADYVNGFFGPDGPYPTLTDEEQAIVNENHARAQFANEIAAQEQRGVPPSFQRPQMGMPTPGRAQAPQRTFWGDFSSLMDNNPEQAWQFLSQAPQRAFQSKMLVQDY